MQSMSFLKQLESDGKSKVVWDEQTKAIIAAMEEEKIRMEQLVEEKEAQSKKPRPRDILGLKSSRKFRLSEKLMGGKSDDYGMNTSFKVRQSSSRNNFRNPTLTIPNATYDPSVDSSRNDDENISQRLVSAKSTRPELLLKSIFH